MRHEIKKLPIISERRLELTKEYCRIHYGFNDYKIDGPKMIVIHYTAFATLSESYECVRPDELPSVREDIRTGGSLNVGTHYLIDRNGDIYSLLPDDVIARHTIGFNHTALSLENVGRDRDHLTEAQVDENVFLVRQLVQQYPSIEYLIGHYEYMDRRLPHFSLFRERDTAYPFTVKQDPGPAFMASLRGKLEKEFNLKLQR